MGKIGKFSVADMKKLQKDLNKIQNQDKQKFIDECAKELAARLLSILIKNTLPGEYPKSSGKKGGTLRRGWTAQRSKGFEVKQDGDLYTIEIVNPVEYASYVEYGHRTADHSGWVPGKFVMTRAEAEIQALAPKVLEAKIKKYLEGMFK
jgi:hypothetical protein